MPPTTSSASTAAAPSLETNYTKDSYIPIFDGNPSSYQEWRKRIHIYHLKMKLQKRAIESVLNIIGSMQGTAWKLLESFDVTKLDEEKSFDMVIEVLDSAFQYDARVRLPVDFDNYFGLSRKPGTTLLSYVTDHDEKYRKVNEHGVKLPDQLQGWLLLRRANITKEQYQLVLSQAPKLEKLRVQEALFVILGQDYKAAVTHDRHDRRPRFLVASSGTRPMQPTTRPMTKTWTMQKMATMSTTLTPTTSPKLLTRVGQRINLIPKLPTTKMTTPATMTRPLKSWTWTPTMKLMRHILMPGAGSKT